MALFRTKRFRISLAALLAFVLTIGRSGLLQKTWPTRSAAL